MKRGYQRNFAEQHPAMYDHTGREAKAKTLIAILHDALGPKLRNARCANIGSSTGIMDSFLAPYVGDLVGVDIDADAIAYAQRTYGKGNLRFQVGDAMALDFEDASVDIVICSQVYEHVPDPKRMMEEIQRILSPGGVCYFAATNKLCVVEQHYFLPFLSMLPQRLADLYLRLTGKGGRYYERHLTFWALKELTSRFEISDYTHRIVAEPHVFHTEYMIGRGSLRKAILAFWIRHFYWAFPGYLWLLRSRRSAVLNEPRKVPSDGARSG